MRIIAFQKDKKGNPMFGITSSWTSPTSSSSKRWMSSQEAMVMEEKKNDVFELDGRKYTPDSLYNLSPAVRRFLDRQILKETPNPLNLLKRRIVGYVHQTYRKPGNRSPLFTICESEPRVVTTFQNFDSLLTPKDHVSRRLSYTYYVNHDHCLRAHTSAHQHNLMQQGLDAFLVIGDVHRRDEVDGTYPCFHQIEGVRLYSKDDLLNNKLSESEEVAELFATSPDPSRIPEKQETHSLDATKATEIQLKQFLESLCDELFGKDAEKRWVETYFSFTHPSYKLEVFYNGQWLEVLGCGIMEQKLLESAGVQDKIGWAFGIGLERIAMVLYGIPDIRLFWSKDTGFLSQFAGKLPGEDVKYKQISAHPQVVFEISFFLPSGTEFNDMTSDVYDTIRTIGGELVEQVKLTDEFENKKKAKKSQTYRIVYRSHEKALTKEECHSDNFDTLFNGDFKEKSMEEMEIKDVKFEDFATVLSFVLMLRPRRLPSLEPRRARDPEDLAGARQRARSIPNRYNPIYQQDHMIHLEWQRQLDERLVDVQPGKPANVPKKYRKMSPSDITREMLEQTLDLAFKKNPVYYMSPGAFYEALKIVMGVYLVQFAPHHHNELIMLDRREKLARRFNYYFKFMFVKRGGGQKDYDKDQHPNHRWTDFRTYGALRLPPYVGELNKLTSEYP